MFAKRLHSLSAGILAFLLLAGVGLAMTEQIDPVHGVEEITSLTGEAHELPLLAQDLIDLGDHEGALRAFERYIAALPPQERELYNDISLVGLPYDVEAYRAILPENREAFLRSFWLRRDPFQTSGGAMRRAEHYRRVWHARITHGKKKWPWDRRGEVYIRYGEPDYRSSWQELNARVPLKVQRIQESLAYKLYGERAIGLTFVGPVFPVRTKYTTSVGFGVFGPSDAIDDIGLVEWKPVTAGYDWSSVPWEVWIYADIDTGLEVVFTDEFHSGAYDYAPIPTLDAHDLEYLHFRSGGHALHLISRLNEYAPEIRVSRIARTEPERYTITHLEPLNFHYEVLSFRGQDGKTDVQVNIGIPIDNVALEEEVDTTVVLERRIALIDSQHTGTQEMRKEMAVPVSRRNRRMMAIDRVNLEAEPGDYRLAVQVGRRNTNRVQVYLQPFTVPDYSGDRLALSDLQLAQQVTEAHAGSDSTFVRGRWRITPSPSSAFYARSPIFAFFEIYNLTQDAFSATRYEVAYEVHASGGDKKAPIRTNIWERSEEAVSIRYEQTGTQTMESDYVELDMGQLAPGRYTVRMTVKDLNSGQVTVREGAFRVLRRLEPDAV